MRWSASATRGREGQVGGTHLAFVRFAGGRSFVGDVAGGRCPLCRQRATKGGRVDGTHLGSIHPGCDACSASSSSSMAVAAAGSRQRVAGGDGGRSLAIVDDGGGGVDPVGLALVERGGVGGFPSSAAGIDDGRWWWWEEEPVTWPTATNNPIWRHAGRGPSEVVIRTLISYPDMPAWLNWLQRVLPRARSSRVRTVRYAIYFFHYIYI